MSSPVVRIARPTDQLEAVVRFYRDALGFELLYEFQDHDGFDGAMLGHPGASWHLEFTHARGHKAERASTQDHLLILYLPDRATWEAAVERMRYHGHAQAPSFNPFWDRYGVTFEDPDGYRVVLQHAAWTR